MSILVTGASAGFGFSICRKMLQQGYKVIGMARRADKLELLKNEFGDLFYPLVCDIQDQNEVVRQLNKLSPEFSEIDLLVNNAGLALGIENAQDCDFNNWQTMINTNVVGLCFLTHQILPKMVAVNNGYIINLGSIAGNYPYPGGNVYGATKAFVRQFSLNLRADLAGTNIRVTNLEPGLCGGSEFSNVRFNGDQAKVDALYANVDYIRPEDIADIVLWLYQQPRHVNINSLEVMPTAQTFSPLKVSRNG